MRVHHKNWNNPEFPGAYPLLEEELDLDEFDEDFLAFTEAKQEPEVPGSDLM